LTSSLDFYDNIFMDLLTKPFLDLLSRDSKISDYPHLSRLFEYLFSRRTILEICSSHGVNFDLNPSVMVNLLWSFYKKFPLPHSQYVADFSSFVDVLAVESVFYSQCKAPENITYHLTPKQGEGISSSDTPLFFLLENYCTLVSQISPSPEALEDLDSLDSPSSKFMSGVHALFDFLSLKVPSSTPPLLLFFIAVKLIGRQLQQLGEGSFEHLFQVDQKVVSPFLVDGGLDEINSMRYQPDFLLSTVDPLLKDLTQISRNVLLKVSQELSTVNPEESLVAVKDHSTLASIARDYQAGLLVELSPAKPHIDHKPQSSGATATPYGRHTIVDPDTAPMSFLVFSEFQIHNKTKIKGILENFSLVFSLNRPHECFGGDD